MVAIGSEGWMSRGTSPSPSDVEGLFRRVRRRDRGASVPSALEGLLTHLRDDSGDVEMPVELLDSMLRSVRRGRIQRVVAPSRAGIILRIAALGLILLAGVTTASLSRGSVSKVSLSDVRSSSSTTPTTIAPSTTSTTQTTVTAPVTTPVTAPIAAAHSTVTTSAGPNVAPVRVEKKLVVSPVTLPVYQKPAPITTSTTVPPTPMPQAPPLEGVYSTGSDCNGAAPTDGVYSSPSSCTTGGPINVNPPSLGPISISGSSVPSQSPNPTNSGGPMVPMSPSTTTAPPSSPSAQSTESQTGS
jgi:hypothetical protein